MTITIIDKDMIIWGTCEAGTQKEDELIQYMAKMNYPENFWLFWIENNIIRVRMPLTDYIEMKGL